MQKSYYYMFRTLTVLCWLFTYTECDIGTFGRGCREICVQCKENTTCHHINGTCMEGCNPGFIGLQCDQGTFFWLKKRVHFIFFRRKMFSLTISDTKCFCTLKHYCINCGQTCPSNYKGCNRFNGVCDITNCSNKTVTVTESKRK